MVLGAAGVTFLLLIVSSVAAAAAFRLGVKRGSKPAPVAPPVAPVEVAPLEVAPPESAPAPLMEAPIEPSTHEASLHARPSWGVLDHHGGAPTDPYAPQPSKPLEMFLAASPMAGNVDGAFVICRFQSFNKADTFAGDDLLVRAAFGSMPEVAANGPEDGNLGFASAPLVSLKRGDAMRFEVYDRDVFGTTLLSRPNVRFAGGPFTTVDAGAAIECRQLAGSALARTVADQTGRADAAVSALARKKLDGQAPDWGYSAREPAAAQRAIGDVAALTGWADARVARRITALDAAVAKVDAQRATVFAGLHDGARASASFEGVDVALGASECHGDTCTVHLTVTNRGADPLHFGGFSGPRVYVANPTSGPVPVRVDATIEGKTSTDVTIEAPAVAEGPAIVGVCARGKGYRDHCKALKLR